MRKFDIESMFGRGAYFALEAYPNIISVEIRWDWLMILPPTEDFLIRLVSFYGIFAEKFWQNFCDLKLNSKFWQNFCDLRLNSKFPNWRYLHERHTTKSRISRAHLCLETQWCTGIYFFVCNIFLLNSIGSEFLTLNQWTVIYYPIIFWKSAKLVTKKLLLAEWITF